MEGRLHVVVSTGSTNPDILHSKCSQDMFCATGLLVSGVGGIRSGVPADDAVLPI